MLFDVLLTQSVELLSKDSQAPPIAVRLFKSGWNDTTKGTFLFDDISIEKVLSAAKDWGNRYSFDYNHASLSDVATPEAGRAAGWYDLEVREGELWAVNIEWTPAMLSFLEKKEFRYTSPAFQVDEYGRIVSVINCAVTNLPATKHLTPLVECRSLPFHAFPIDHDATWDASAAVERLRKWASSDGSGDPDKMNWHKYSLGFAWRDDRFKKTTFAAYKLPHHDVVDGKLVTIKAGVIAAAAAVQGARGGMDIPTTDKPGVRAHLAAHYKQMGANPPWENKMNLADFLKMLKDDPEGVKGLLTTLGISPEQIATLGKGGKGASQPSAKDDDDDDDDDDDADDEDKDSDDDDDETKAKKMKARKAKRCSRAKLARVIAASLGTTDPDQLVGKLTAFGARDEQVKKLTKVVEDMQKAADSKAVESTLAEAIKCGKVAPGNEKLITQLKAMSPAALNAFVEAMPAIVLSGSHEMPRGEEDPKAPLQGVDAKVFSSILGDLKGPDGKTLSADAARSVYLTTKKENTQRATAMA